MQRSPQKHVLLTADTLGGVWTYAVSLARALAPSGWTFCLATLGRPPTDYQRAQAAALPNVRLVPSEHPLEWMPGDPWPGVEASREWLQALVDEEKPDLVHLNSFGQPELRTPCPKLLGAHSCVRTWWRAVHGTDAPAGYERYTECVSAALRSAAFVVTPTRALLNDMKDVYGEFAPAQHVHNGIDFGPFSPVPKKPVVFAAGRLWDEGKNLGMLVRIAPRLRAPLHVAGEGAEARPRENLTALGQLPHDQIRARLAEAAVFVHPARYEPFGLAPLEAAASGCALVLSDLPSLREVWGDAATFVPANDEGAWVDAVNRLLADERLRRRQAARCFARSRRFSLKRLAQNYHRLYARLLERPDIAPPLIKEAPVPSLR